MNNILNVYIIFVLLFFLILYKYIEKYHFIFIYPKKSFQIFSKHTTLMNE